jgi:DNA-binding beta-propeller fold protein YncE
MLYTLYTRADGAPGYADVHALSLDGGFVHCTDLPASLHITPTGGAIAASPDGHHLYVASASGTVAEIDASASSPQPFAIVHTAQVAASPGATIVALAADDHTVWVGLGSSLVGLDSTDLHVVSTSNIDQPIHALAVEAAGTLFAATADAVESVQPLTGAVQVVAPIAGPPTRLTIL